MRSAVDDLGLERLLVVYPGERPYPLDERVVVVPLGALVGGDGVDLVSHCFLMKVQRDIAND